MKKFSRSIITILIVIIASICLVWGLNILMTNFVDNTNIVCKGQEFQTVEEAIKQMEKSERELNDTSLDYCPPYKIAYTIDCKEHTIVFFKYCHNFDGPESSSYAVRILKHNPSGTLSFEPSFANFHPHILNVEKNPYYFTNIRIGNKRKSISFLYLHKNSTHDIYVDGHKAEKILANLDGEEFYICYAVSKPDTFLSNIFTPVSQRHKIEIK